MDINFNPKDTIFSLDIGTRSVIGTVGIVKEKKFVVLAESYVEHQERAMIDGQIHDISLVANAVTYVKFELEAKGSDYQNNENFVEYKSYTEFNSYAIGKSKFFNTSVSALFGTVNADGTFTQSSETLLQLRDFIQNGKLKYFKDKKGNIFAGLTHNYKQSVLDNGIQSQPFTISFDFVETQKI